MWVKICGTTSLEDAQLAADAGADALGFIFAPSPRQVSVSQVAAMIPRLPAALETYGVFVNAGFDEIVSTVEEAGLSGVQLHSASDPALRVGLRRHFASHSGFRILQVLHFSTATELASALQSLSPDGSPGDSPDAVLVDSRTEQAAGGTGLPFDWAAARGAFRAAAPEVRLVAAGGLTPLNVTAAIESLQPWGVDVVTGVEAAPGRKDPALLQAFLATARPAAGRAFPLADGSARH